MSPIRAETRGRYPADWPAISKRIREERAGGRCECDGRCGSAHCIAAGSRRLRERHPHLPARERCTARHLEPHPSTGSRVVLTVAHLDHQPEHCDDDNLAAMCQACHLAYDREHHAETRARTRVAARAVAAGQLALGGPE